MPIRNTRRVDSRFRDSQGKWITLVFLIRRVFIDLFFKEASGDFLINPSIYLKLLDVSTSRLFCLKWYIIAPPLPKILWEDDYWMEVCEYMARVLIEL